MGISKIKRKSHPKTEKHVMKTSDNSSDDGVIPENASFYDNIESKRKLHPKAEKDVISTSDDSSDDEVISKNDIVNDNLDSEDSENESEMSESPKKKIVKKLNIDESDSDENQDDEEMDSNDDEERIEDNEEMEVDETTAGEGLDSQFAIDGDEEEQIESLATFYSHAQRALLEDDNVKRLDFRTRDLQNKVFNINTEADYTDDDKLEMPKTGILVDGIPFHHRHNYPLEKRHIKRLYAHGIIYKTNRFSGQEDCQLVKNWIQYARKYSIDFEDAPMYMGWIKSIDKVKFKEIKRKVDDQEFHGFMCLRLIQRCAAQVRRRCYRVFNPRSEEWRTIIKTKTFTEAEDRRLLQLVSIYNNQWQKIAYIMGKNRFDVQKRHVFLTEGHHPVYDTKTSSWKFKEFTPELTKDMYNLLKDYMEVHPVHLVTVGNDTEIARTEDAVDWMRVSQSLSVFPDQCIDKWKELKTMIRNAYEKLDDPDIPISRIEKEIFSPNPNEPKVRKLKTPDLQKCFEILHTLAKEQNINELFEVDVRELTRRLKEANLNFYTVYSVGGKVLRIANEILNNLRRHEILPTLPKSMKIWDLIEMLAHISGKADSIRGLTMTKKQVLKLIKEYLIMKGLEIDPKYTVLYRQLDDDEEEDAEIEDQPMVVN